MLRLACTSDWHAAEHAWKKLRSLTGDAEYSLEQLVDFAIEEALDAVLAAGDLYDDASPSPQTQIFVHRQIDRLQKAGVPLLYVVGQHERCIGQQRLSVHPWPEYIDRKTVEIDGVHIRGLSWVPEHMLAEELQAAHDSGPVDVFLGHQVWSDGMRFGVEGFSGDCPGEVIVTGDLHKHEVRSVRSSKTDEKITVLSPGSMSMQSIDEPPQKAFWLLSYTNPGQYDYKSIPLVTRKVIHVEVQADEELEDFEQDARSLLRKDPDMDERIRTPILRITYLDSIPNAYNRITAAVSDRAHLFLDPIKTGERSGSRVELRSAPRSPREGIATCLKTVAAENSPEYKTAVRLLGLRADTDRELSQTVAAELDAILEEHTRK